MIASRERAHAADALAAWTALAAAAAPSLGLPRASLGSSVAAGEVAEVCVGNAAVMHDVAALAAREGVADSGVWLAVFAALLYRYSGELQILLAVSDEPETVALVRLSLSPEMSFRALLALAAQSLAEAQGARSVPVGALTQLAAQLGDARPAVAHAAFGWESAGERTSAARLFEAGGFDLGLFRGTPAAPPEMFLRYRPAVFETATLQRFAGHVTTLLSAVARDPGLPLGSVPLLTPAEHEAFARWNATEEPLRSDATVVDLLREQAARTPEAVALQCDDATLSYGDLDERADRLAAYLRARGVGPDVLVALLVERSLDMYVAVFGIQRAGGAYVPVDPEYPRERIAFMLADSRAALVVVHESLRAKLPEGADAGATPVVSLDAERGAIAASPAALPAAGPRPGDLAYVIYTSGSTGQPKGVQIEHRQVVNLLKGLETVARLTTGDTLLALAPLAFDMSGVDLYLPLTSGGRVVIASREVAVNPKALATLMARSCITYMQATPSTWRMLLEAGWPGAAALTILCGGEALPPQLAEQLLASAPRVWNLYGPTEATIWATAIRLRAGEPITVGRPLANVAAYVLDAARQPVPIGVAGELYLGGAGVARGYLHRPELTAERFVPDPFSRRPGRMYRTGDVARFRADGTIEYLGRADFQVKLRGYRIELGEVETALGALADVRAAVVTLREDVPGDPQLVAYAVVRPGSTARPTTLRRALIEKLPAYMVPDAVVFVDALPLSANGKIDRARLPAPARERRAESDGSSPRVPARSALEARLVAIWEETLDARPVGVTDDFFALGASSITAARVFDRIERELGAHLPLSPLFAAPTIERLAALIASGEAERRYTALVAIQPHGEKTPLFCIHGGAGTILHFQPLSHVLGGTQPVYGLQMQGLYGDAPLQVSVEAMAAHYVRELRTVQPRGPYALLGYCFGANVAFAMARQLVRSGERVGLLATVNGPSPRYILAHRRPAGRRWKVRKFAYVVRARAYAAFRRPLPDAWRERTIFLICNAAEERFKPGVYDGSMLLFKAAGLYDEATLGWDEHVARGVDVVEVAGEHKNARIALREPHVSHVGARLREALRRAFEPAAPQC